jgi:hypothetical protein
MSKKEKRIGGRKKMSENLTLKVVKICRAGSVGDIHPPATRIVIEENVDRVNPRDIDVEKHRAFYAKQGKALADALYSCLPGGTFDALLCELLERTRSVLMVAYKHKG